jgi:ABC-type transporter Mla subunit MlaD
MAFHDLTPELRTRLSRVERLVGMFVVVAVVLLIMGLSYYVYRLGARKGWFVRKLPYFTFVNNATGLRAGDPVKLMGFDIGEITEITAQPPFDYFDVYVAFVVREEYVGYIWDDSRAVVASSDFLGKRAIEVIKGTNGPPTYLFYDVRKVSMSTAVALEATNYFLAQSVYDSTSEKLLTKAYERLDRVPLQRLSDQGMESIEIFDKGERTQWPSAIWDYKEARYRTFDRTIDKGFFLPPLEAPALAARLEKVADTVEAALPGILALTNRLNRVLDQATETAANADDVLQGLRPVLVNLAQVSANLTNGQGSLGDWILGPEMRRQLTETVSSANSLLTNSDARLELTTTNVTLVLLNLASVTSNLNAQVAANTNILSEISSAVRNADDLVQGLKRHWLLRSAFREPKSGQPATTKPRSGRAVSPKNR